MSPWLTIVVPMLDEERSIVDCLALLAPLRDAGAEVIAVDGGSQDNTVTLALDHCDRVLSTTRGRAVQMNAGASAARGDLLLFLHADTRLPPGAGEALRRALDEGVSWGRFDVVIAGQAWMLRVIASLINLRSRVSGVATGDQAIFVRRDVFLAQGGYPAIPLMEDIALSDALRRVVRPRCLRMRASTSGRRWERNGVWRTILLMWFLRAGYRLGVQPDVLARRYAAARSD